MNDTDIKKLIIKTAKEFLEKTGLIAQDISLEKSGEYWRVKVTLPVDVSGMLVGRGGKTLYSFQLILSLIIQNQLGEWQPITVDVNNYRRERRETLKKMALNAAQKVKFSGQAVTLSYLPSPERRVVHQYLNDDPEVTTESVGEGRNRYLMIKPA